MTETDRRRKGVSAYLDILRPQENAHPEDKAVLGIRELTLDHLYAEIWQRGGLSKKERRLITIALLAVQGHGNQLKSHVAGAIRSGVAIDTLRELMVHVGHYGGWAAGTSGHEVVEQVYEEESK